MRVATMFLVFLALLISVTEGFSPCEDYQGKIWKNNQCSLAAKDNVWNSFNSYLIMVNCSNCHIVYGKSLEDLQKKESYKSKIISGLLSWIYGSVQGKKHGSVSIRLPPNVNWYIGVQNPQDERVKMSVKMGLDPTCVACLVLGTLFFFSASRLSHSVEFYYTSGISIGILASLLLLIFILSRFVPKKPVAYTILIGGWSLGGWIMAYIWNNWHKLFTEYFHYFIAYLAISGFVSFAICYWKGPVSNPKIQHIIEWSIQLCALCLLYSSSQLKTVSVGLVTSVIIGSLVFSKHEFRFISPLVTFFKKYVWRKRPEPPKLLTEEEYRRQGEIETRKALEELREYCNSPKCSPWKTMSRIKSPAKFISFVEGENHVSDAEMTLHDAELPELDDDDENDSSLISEDEIETDYMHKGDNGTTHPKEIENDPNISEDED